MPNLRAFSLDGRRALVTGGATGIGAAIAGALAAAGADVALTYHSRPPEETIAAIGGCGKRAAAIKTDLAALDDRTAEALVAEAEEQIGPIDILVNNAGIIHREDALDHGWDDWRRVLSVNLDAAWLLSQAAGSGMAERGWGRIISIGSVLSFQGGIRVPAYTASKHALIGLTRALANELAARGVTVNAIAPGYVTTENTGPLRADAERMRSLLARIPAGRFAEPDEIAGAAVFLASEAASYITGSVVTVDGGWLAR